MKDKDLIKRLLFPYMAKMFLSAYSIIFSRRQG